MRRFLLLFFVVTTVLILAIILKLRLFTSSEQTSKITITASFYPLAYFASSIGGDHVFVTTITPAGAEPHDYEPTTQDIITISKSRLLILNGGNVEPWGDKIKDQLKGTSTQVLVAGDGLFNQNLQENGQKIIDPHIWLDPLLAKKEAEAIEKHLVAIDPAHQGDYLRNLKTLETELDALDRAYKAAFTSCTLKSFVTSHAAFGYLATQYNLTQIAISGISPDEEPSTQKIAEIAQLVKSQHIPYIFFESLVSPKLSDTIAAETGAQTLVLDPLEGIPQEKQVSGANYFTIQEQNLVNLRKALICQ